MNPYESNYLNELISNSKQIEAHCIIDNHIYGISDICLNNQNKDILAASSFDSTISLYDLNTTKEISLLKGHSKGVWTINYQPKSNLLLSGGSDYISYLWDTSSNKQISKFEIHKNNIYDVQFSQQGNLFATCSKDCICIWDMKNMNKPIDLIKESKGELKDFIYCCNFLEDEEHLLTGFIDGSLIIHKLHNKLENDTLINIPAQVKFGKDSDDVYNKSIFGIEFLNKQKNLFLLTHSDGSVRVYKYNKDKNNVSLIDKYYYFTDAVTYAQTNENDTKIIASSKDRTGEIWEYGNHSKISYSLIGHKNVVSSALFYGNNKAITSSFDNTVRIWNVPDEMGDVI